MDILHHIDRLEELVGDARKIPVGGGVVIGRQRLLDLIDRMRVSVPKEVYDAREVIEKRDDVLEDAGAEASRIIARAGPTVTARGFSHSTCRPARAALMPSTGCQ